MRRLWPILLVLAAVAAGLWFWVGRDTNTTDARLTPIVLPMRTFALNLDPSTMADIDSRKVGTLIYTGLVAVDQNGTVRPRVARSWRRLDPNTMEFTLASGITFPDGTPVTAQRVGASLCAAMQPAHIQSWSLASIARTPGRTPGSVECSGIEAQSSTVLLIRESTPTPWLMEALAGPGGWIVDVSKQPGRYGIRPGTGPFTIASVAPDSGIDLRARQGGALPAHVDRVEFRYLPEAAVAASNFAAGRLDFLQIDTPQLAELVLDTSGRPTVPNAQILRADVDRVRVVAFNLRRLAQRGLSQAEIHTLLSQYSRAVPREQIARRARGMARPMSTPFPPVDRVEAGETDTTAAEWRRGDLTLLTEADPYSDMIASQLPTSIGGAPIRYRTVDKNVLIEALVGGNYDAALITIEATHHTPKFWAAFFTPGDPYVAFGAPVAGLPALNLSDPRDLERAAQLIQRDGNWVGILRDVGIFGMSQRLSGVRLTGSGQLSFEEIGLRE